MASWFRRASTPGAVTIDPENAAAAQGSPLLLIGFNEATKTWEVGQEAVSVLQSIKGPLCTISVCGRARQGKSFLLNQILGRFTGVDRPKGFQVSATHQSCTRGIWIWSKPVVLPGPDGSKCNTILMDCEGVDAVDQGQQHSAQIFCLAVLLSSIFMYNQIGAIDAIAIERLAMVCELTMRMKAKTLPGASSRHRNAQVDFNPAFLWLLRDFQLVLEKNGHKLSPAEYLEDALTAKEGGRADLDNKNQARPCPELVSGKKVCIAVLLMWSPIRMYKQHIHVTGGLMMYGLLFLQMRNTIKTVFPDRDVAILVRPALTEKDLQNLENLQADKLRPEFKKDMDNMLQLLRAKVRPLEVQGMLLNGQNLARLTHAYVAAINQGAVPELVTAWQGIARAESQKAYEAALAAYQQNFQYQGINDNELYSTHQAAVAAALQAFKSLALGDARLLSELEGKLRKELEDKYVQARHKIAVSGEKIAADMLSAEAVKLRNLMIGPTASVEAVEKELSRFLDEYDTKVAAGAYKYKRAAEFLMNVPIAGLKSIVKDLIAAKDSAIAKAGAAESTIAQLRAELGRLSDADVKAADIQQQLLAAQQESARLSGQLEAKARHVSTLESELTAARQQDAAASATQQRMQQELAAAQAELLRLQGQLAEVANLKSQIQQLQQQLGEANQQNKQSLEQQAQSQQEVARLAGQLNAEQAVTARLQAENAAGRSELEKVRAELADVRIELEGAQQEQVGQSRLQGQLDEERRKVTEQMQEISKLTNDLIKERKEHDSTREQLAAAKAVAPRGSGSMRSPAASAGASPAGAGAGPSGSMGANTASHTNRKRRRMADLGGVDEEMPEAATPGPAAAAPVEPAAPAARTPINKDIEPTSMTVVQLKTWVTDSNLEDDNFFKMSQSSKTKKQDWVKYVKQKLESL